MSLWLGEEHRFSSWLNNALSQRHHARMLQAAWSPGDTGPVLQNVPCEAGTVRGISVCFQACLFTSPDSVSSARCSLDDPDELSLKERGDGVGADGGLLERHRRQRQKERKTRESMR